MTHYMLTAFSTGTGWRDIEILNAGDIREAIAAAEKVTGCKVSHGRGGLLGDWHPGLRVDLESGEVTQLHNRPARPEVALGPPDVVRAIALALQPRPKAPPKRKTGRDVGHRDEQPD